MPISRRHKNFQGRNFNKKRRTDALSRSARSTLMSRVRASGSRMEASFVAILGSRCKETFKANDPTVLGKPDLVFRELKVCIFLDSDFWHGWQFPRWKHLMKSQFWRNKIQRNRERDKEVTRKLRREGWTVIRFWEHNLRGKIQNAVTAVTLTVFSKRRSLTSERRLKIPGGRSKSFPRIPNSPRSNRTSAVSGCPNQRREF